VQFIRGIIPAENAVRLVNLDNDFISVLSEHLKCSIVAISNTQPGAYFLGNYDSANIVKSSDDS
jgi:hypothetical protein